MQPTRAPSRASPCELPVVIADLDVTCRVNQEEIFGPVVTITPFRTEDEVVRYANVAPFGLSASLWTRDLGRGHRVAERLECGTVWVNCWLLRDLRTPFGGVKQSRVGREGGDEALRFSPSPRRSASSTTWKCVDLAPGHFSIAA